MKVGCAAFQTWFWQFNSEKRQLVAEKKKAYNAARSEVYRQERLAEKLVSQARAELGLWSDFGVHDSKRLFW